MLAEQYLLKVVNRYTQLIYLMKFVGIYTNNLRENSKMMNVNIKKLTLLTKRANAYQDILFEIIHIRLTYFSSGNYFALTVAQ